MVVYFEGTFLGFTAIFIISLVSFVGALTLAFQGKRLPAIYSLLIAFAAGALLGTVMYHILPESVEIRGGFTNDLATLVLIGLLIPFVLEKGIHWHHHHSLEHKNYTKVDAKDQEKKIKPFVFVNLFGDGLHNFVDGVILIATFSISTELGLATFAGILIHELAQEMGEFSILIEGGLETKKALMWNFFSALTAVVGGLFALIFDAETMESIILPIAAGNFLYLAIADIIPELHQKVKRKDWIVQLTFGTLGVGVMYLLTFIE